MYDVVIFTALGWERRAVTDALTDVVPAGAPRTWRGRMGDGAACLVVQTGIGPERARAAVAAVPPVRLIMGAGCAGGLAPDLRTGDLVVARAVLPLGGASLGASGEPVAAWAADRGLAIRLGPIASSATVLRTPARKLAAGASGALVVDMESAAHAAAARARCVPFVAVRVVLDEAHDALPLDVDLVDESTGEVRPGRVLAALTSRPTLWPRLPRLARQSRTAAFGLRAFMAELLGAGGLAALGLVPPPRLAAIS